MKSSEANAVIEKVRKQSEELEAKVGTLTKKDFKLYKSLMSGLRKDSSLSLAINFFTMARRLVLLYVAMFVAQYAWLQIMVFMAFSLVSSLHLVYTWPFKKRAENQMSIFNEIAMLLVSYLVMMLVGLSAEINTMKMQDMRQDAGLII